MLTQSTFLILQGRPALSPLPFSIRDLMLEGHCYGTLSTLFNTGKVSLNVATVGDFNMGRARYRPIDDRARY